MVTHMSIPGAWQILPFAGLLIWLFLVVRAVRPALKVAPEHRGLLSPSRSPQTRTFHTARRHESVIDFGTFSNLFLASRFGQSWGVGSNRASSQRPSTTAIRTDLKESSDQAKRYAPPYLKFVWSRPPMPRCSLAARRAEKEFIARAIHMHSDRRRPAFRKGELRAYSRGVTRKRTPD